MRDFLQGQASGLEGLRPGREGEDFNRKNTLEYFESRLGGMSLTQRLRKIAIFGQPPSRHGSDLYENAFIPSLDAGSISGSGTWPV